MTPEKFLANVIAPRAALLPQYDSPAARCLLLAIAGQESGWSQRLQEPVPFARGFWQCEKLGGVLAVVTNDVTRPVIYGICNTLCIPLGLDEINEAIAWNDTLAYWVARMFLWMDPPPLPAIGDTAGAYETYLRVWRPGKRNDATWPVHYGAAAALFTAAIPAITETQPEGQAT